MDNRIRFFNIYIDNITMNEAIEKIKCIISSQKPGYVVTPNVDHIVKLSQDEEFLKVYQEADLVLTDGTPLIWISKLLKRPIKEKISGSDLFPQICKLASENHYKVFLLGAAEGIGAAAAENMVKLYPGINIVGTYSPRFGFENNGEEINKIIRIVRAANPDILIVGLGAPKQEKFIYKYKEHFGVPVSLALGASIDFMAGNIKRAPKWVSQMGLEWFYRFLREPRRLFKRYFVDDMKIFRMVWKYYRNGNGENENIN